MPAACASPGSLNAEVQELLRGAVVEPVDNFPGDDLPECLIVGENLYRHSLIDDLPYCFLAAVGKGNAGMPGRASEHYPDLFPELVNENCGGLRLAQRARDLAECLGHETGLQPDVAVPHLALDLSPRHERGYRVDDHDIDCPGAYEHVGDLQRLLASVRLGDQQRVGVNAELLGVLGVERVLCVDEGGDPAGLLRISYGMQRYGGFPAALRSVYLDHPAARETADSERHIQRDRSCRDYLNRRAGIVAEPHDRAAAELPLDLGERGLQGLLPVAALGAARLVVRCHLNSRPGSRAALSRSLRVVVRTALPGLSFPAAGTDATRGHRQFRALKLPGRQRPRRPSAVPL